MAETPDISRPDIKLFYCYAREDETLRDELHVNLAGLRRQYRLTSWHDRKIIPGETWEEAIDRHLSTADVVLLLISPHFVDSDYCYSKEMQRALERHHADQCRVIPILLRPTYWEETPLSAIQMLPTDARPITSWPDRYEAFHDVARGIATTIKALLTLRARKTKQDWVNEGNALYNLKRHDEALTAFEQAIRLDPSYTLAHTNKGVALRNLNRHEEALAAHEQAIRLDPNFADAYINKGVALRDLKRYVEALAAYEQAIRLNPNDADTYYNKGNALRDLKRYVESLAAYEQAIRLNPNYTDAYYNKSLSLQTLGRSKEAEQAFEKARQLGYQG